MILEYTNASDALEAIDIMKQIIIEKRQEQGYQVQDGAIVGKNAKTGADALDKEKTEEWDVVRESPDGTVFFNTPKEFQTQEWKQAYDNKGGATYNERSKPSSWANSTLPVVTAPTISLLSGFRNDVVAQWTTTLEGGYVDGSQYWESIEENPAVGNKSDYKMLSGGTDLPSTDEPTFKVDHFNYDGGDYHTPANREDWVNNDLIGNMHKVSSGKKFTVIGVCRTYAGDSTPRFFYTGNTAAGQPHFGIEVRKHSLGKAIYAKMHSGASSQTRNAVITTSVRDDKWFIFSVSVDHEAKKLHMRLNDAKAFANYNFSLLIDVDITTINKCGFGFFDIMDISQVAILNSYIDDTDDDQWQEIVDYYKSIDSNLGVDYV